MFPGGHVHIHLEIDGKAKSNKYTAISPVNAKGKMEFVIKIYRKDNPDV